MESPISFIQKSGNNYIFSCFQNLLIISLPDNNICRVRVHSGTPHDSLMVKLGFVKEIIDEVQSNIFEAENLYRISSPELDISLNKDNSNMKIYSQTGDLIFNLMSFSDIIPGSNSKIHVGKAASEHFHGFGFQRRTLDANGHRLSFKKEYRWEEATVPYFLSSSGYGFSSANTFNHTFDFANDRTYSIEIFGGDIDFCIIHGPCYKKIIKSYTGLTGRPHMAPAYTLGLCYVGRLFETQKGILDIASRFRDEGIPCDMIGLEPGWEEHYYQMKWVWNKSMFPNPQKMINALHEMGYAFELWESGDAPIAGYVDPEIRKDWFSQRIPTSLEIGVDFYKQDDPYPRCITSEEMVTNPSVESFSDDEETRNIANTLYSRTVFDEMRKITGKRAFIIFHAYCSTISSQMYPCVWAGDFGLGNGALNAGLSGHAMVTQDMRNEVPSGIHFGFLMPFVFMDSWAYYLEPWLFSEHMKEMNRFYSRLRISLFPYLYTMLWQSHTTGLPMMRPMLLEFQDDPAAAVCENQYMLGDSLLVGLNINRDTDIHLPEGKWVDYWERKTINSDGSDFNCTWPSHAGGPLYVKAGSIIPMMNASDSIKLNKRQFLMADIYPGGKTKMDLYEDDGISYGYEKGEYVLTSISCIDSNDTIQIAIDEITKAVLVKVFLDNSPNSIESKYGLITQVKSLDTLLYTYENGWYFDEITHSLYIKGINGWKFSEHLCDMKTFYGGNIEFRADFNPCDMDFKIHRAESVSKIESKTESPGIIPGNCIFNAVINPPERVRLNHGDDWLPHYIYVSYEIISNGERVKSVNPEVMLKISENIDKNLYTIYKSRAYHGVGHFEKIIVSAPSKPPDVQLTLMADGVSNLEMNYKI